MSAPGEPKATPAPMSLAGLAREAAEAISALCEAQDDVRREPMSGQAFAGVNVAGEWCYRALNGMHGEMCRGLRRDEIASMRRAVALGIVAPAWALRVVAIATEVGHG